MSSSTTKSDGLAPARRIALLIEYDGAAYHGSQLQKSDPSIQGTLEAAIEKLTGEHSRLAFAGRTDAGVHARGQVAAFNTTSDHELSVFETGLNAWLPKDIAIRNAIEADPSFDPRRHAIQRTYRYTIYNAPLRSPLSRARAWHVQGSLDIEAMREAASALVGEHDFASFTRDEGVSTVRCMRSCDVVQEPPTVSVEVTANAFLRHQVRRTVGALVEVGSARLSLQAFRGLLAKPAPATAGPVAPPHGLCLEEVGYQGLDLTNEYAL